MEGPEHEVLFGNTPMFNGKELHKVFSWLRKFVKA